MARLPSQAEFTSCSDSACRIEEFLVVRQLSGLLVLRGPCSLSCVAVRSATTLSGIFACLFSATTMIEGSFSQRTLNLPTNIFSRSLPLSLQGNLWLPLSLMLSLACDQYSSRRLPEVSPDRLRLYYRSLRNPLRRWDPRHVPTR